MVKFRRAVIILGILSSAFLMTARAWQADWAGATFFFAVTGFFGTQLRKDRDTDCPNARCVHAAELHALNVGGDWRCQFEGCRCGLRLVVHGDR